MKTLDELAIEVVENVRKLSPGCTVSDKDISCIAGVAIAVLYKETERNIAAQNQATEQASVADLRAPALRLEKVNSYH